jgi:hypothetical protein
MAERKAAPKNVARKDQEASYTAVNLRVALALLERLHGAPDEGDRRSDRGEPRDTRRTS